MCPNNLKLVLRRTDCHQLQMSPIMLLIFNKCFFDRDLSQCNVVLSFVSRCYYSREGQLDSKEMNSYTINT